MLYKVNLIINKNKSEFYIIKIIFLKYEILEKEIRIKLAKVKVI